jgi:hypothetical protein
VNHLSCPVIPIAGLFIIIRNLDMAKVIKKTQGRTAPKQLPLWKNPSPFSIYFDSTNYILLAAGVVALIIGFVLLSQKPWDSPSALVTAPLVLIAAYIVILPAAILFRSKGKKTVEVKES